MQTINTLEKKFNTVAKSDLVKIVGGNSRIPYAQIKKHPFDD